MRVTILALGAIGVTACTNLLVSKGASADGSTILAYNSDDMNLFGSIDLRPAADHPPGARRSMWDWDSQRYTGSIPEVSHSLNVVGNTNEAGVIITETTFGGRGDLDGHGTGAIMSYGDLIFTTLQRASSAREAITIMTDLCTTFGYESNGESFGIGDGDEVWLMELVGKGKYGKGAVWVASRVPEGYVGATANQARTETFDQHSPDVLFAPDLIPFARSIGAFPADAPDAAFNFREAFDPITFSGARFGEARVWSLFNPICGGCVDGSLEFAKGYNLSASMPLFVKPTAPLSLANVMAHMRNHNEDTWFDNTGRVRPDVGAGPGHSPYRYRPLVWQYNNVSYLNERTVGVQQSGWAFIAQSRGWLPPPIRALEWFAPDDSSTSPRIPVYGGSTRIPPGFGSLVGQTPGGGIPDAPVADGFTMSLDSAFWIWNLVGNIAFAERYGDALPMVLDNVEAEQARMAALAARLDTDFVALYKADPVAASAFLADFTVSTGNDMLARWKDFWFVLFATFRDGGVLLPSKDVQCVPPQVVNCTCKKIPGERDTSYDDEWRGRIVHDSDNAVRYRVPDGALDSAAAQAKLRVM